MNGLSERTCFASGLPSASLVENSRLRFLDPKSAGIVGEVKRNWMDVERDLNRERVIFRLKDALEQQRKDCQRKEGV
jgi:hypothetical protein